MNKKETEHYLSYLKSRLMRNKKKQSINLTSDWIKSFPKKSGIYVIFENGKPVYVGETGNLRGRMGDLTRTKNHSFRRNLGQKKFSKLKGYEDATTKKDFGKLEKKLDNLIKKNFKICALVLGLGRKELEEKLIEDYELYDSNKGYNRKRKRKIKTSKKKK